MQGLTSSIRKDLTTEEVMAVLTGDSVTVDYGAEIVNLFGGSFQDISDRLKGGEIRHDNNALIHSSVRLNLMDVPMTWGRTLVQPYMVMSNATTSVKFNLGIYVMTTPKDDTRGEDPETREVEGYDILYYLAMTGPGDSWAVPAGQTYADALWQVIARGTSPFLNMYLDGTGAYIPLPTPMTWCVTDAGAPSWLQIANDLLAAAGYTSLWVDEGGGFHARPYQAPRDRSPEWTFDTSDSSTNLVGEDRSASLDAWGVPNWWRFIRKGMTSKPTEGSGLYTVSNTSEGPTCQDVIGYTLRKVVFLDAADQTTLVAQGNAIVAADKATTRTFDIKVDPLPCAGHEDIVMFSDLGVSTKCRVISWSLPLDGSPGDWKLEAV